VISSQSKVGGDTALERLRELPVVALCLGAPAVAPEESVFSGLLEAVVDPAPRLLDATLFATVAAGAVREIESDDVQHTCKVRFETSGVAGVMDGSQQLPGHDHEVVEADADLAEVVTATEVEVRDAEGLKARGRSEHGE